MGLWEKFRESKIDELAMKCGVVYRPVEGKDFRYANNGKDRLYNIDYMLSSLKDDFKIEAKKNHPYKYFFLVSIPDVIEDIFYWWPATAYSSVKNYIRFNFFSKYHIVKTGLKPDYYDADMRIEGALETILIDFVEEESSWMEVVFNKEMYKKYNPWQRRWFGNFREPELGVQHIKWQIKVSEGEKKQALKKILAAYIFFKEKRPAMLIEKEKLSDTAMEFKGKAANVKWKLVWKLEAKIRAEDTKHLLTIVEHRHLLWT